MGNKVLIDLLSLEKGKVCGFQEYIYNLLNYFYHHRENVLCGRIFIWCMEGESDFFVKFADKFEIEGYGCSFLLRRGLNCNVRCSCRFVPLDTALRGERRVAA